MTQQNKLIILIIFLAALSAVMIAYRFNRSAKVKRLRSEIAMAATEQNKKKSAEAEVLRLTKLFPATPDTASFIESLYSEAKAAGLIQHDVSTDAVKAAASARPGSAETAAAGGIAKHKLKITVAGTYRNIAEYIRRVQNIERFNRITELKMSPDTTSALKGSMVIELYSLTVKK